MRRYDDGTSWSDGETPESGSEPAAEVDPDPLAAACKCVLTERVCEITRRAVHACTTDLCHGTAVHNLEVVAACLVTWMSDRTPDVRALLKNAA
jgi:hypothetical protein